MVQQRFRISTVDEVQQIIESLKVDLEPMTIAEEQRKDIQLCLMEAIHNGLTHGNQGDYNKAVIIQWTINDEGFVFSVEDQGDGYAESKQMKETDENDPLALLDEHGRGIFFIEALMDEVWFNQRGNQINGKVLWKLND